MNRSNLYKTTSTNEQDKNENVTLIINEINIFENNIDRNQKKGTTNKKTISFQLNFSL